MLRCLRNQPDQKEEKVLSCKTIWCASGFPVRQSLTQLALFAAIHQFKLQLYDFFDESLNAIEKELCK